MYRSLILGSVSILGLTSAALAEVPAVATDIPPVHSLASIVMEGVGTPDLLVQPGASPHGYSLRPSEARALDQADIVFWIGEGLEPWFAGSLEALAADAKVVELAEVDGTTELEFREGATFETHDHDHEDDHGDHDDHGDDHAEEHHDHGDDHAGEQSEHDDDHEHDHHHGDGHDPHVWLDPENARVWLSAMAEELAQLDPENADTYRANAEKGRAQLAALIEQVSADLAPVRESNFVVFHDAYQYFENRFDVPATGSITLSDASDPSPARIEEVHDKVRDLDVTCAFSEPQFNPNLVSTVFEGTEARTGIMDPLGTDLEPGTALYPQLIRNLAGSLLECLD